MGRTWAEHDCGLIDAKMADGIMVLTVCKVLLIRDSRFAVPLKTSLLVIDET